MAEIEIVMIDAPDQRPTTSFADLVRNTANVAQALVQDRGIAFPLTRLVAAGDLLAAIDSESSRLGLTQDRRTGLERVGGSLAGKCLSNDAGTEYSVVLSVELATTTDNQFLMETCATVAHELGHVVYGCAREADIGRFSDVWLPWEQAEMISVVAAEEFRVDQLAYLILDHLVTASTIDGQPIAVREVMEANYKENLDEALDRVVPDLQEIIWQYRLHGTPLDELWASIVSTSEGIAIYLAHLEATNETEGVLTEGMDHPAVDLLAPLWRPLFDYVRRSPRLPATGDWSADREKLKKIGLDGLTDVWRRLGVVASPSGDTFHLAIGAPAWP